MSSPSLPLLGALLVAEGFLSQGQVEACLLLQQNDYPQLRLGEIAIRCGYLSMEELDYVLRLQQEFRQDLTSVLDTHAPIPADLNVLVITRSPSSLLTSILASMGAAAHYADRLPSDLEVQPELILLDSALLACCDALPESCFVALLPSELCKWRGIHAPQGGRALLQHYMRQARARAATLAIHSLATRKEL